MLRALLINLLTIVLTAVCGVLILRGLSRDPHLREMYFAASVVLIAAELAVIPMFLARRSNQLGVSQAGLIATVVHLFGSAGIAMAASSLLHLTQPFLFWTLAFYWMTLISMCYVIIVAIRKAPTTQPSAVQK